MHARLKLPVAALLLLIASSAEALPVPGLFDTGVDGTGAALPSGAVDPHYVLISSADGAYPGPSSIVASVIPAGYWMLNTAASQWIAPAADEDWPALGTALAAGDYVYRLTFDLSNFVATSVQVTGGYAVDNSGAILINGTPVPGSSPSYGGLGPFTIMSGFVAGINHLDFVVSNWPAGGSNPTGLRVSGLQGTGSSTTDVADDESADGLRLLGPSPNPARSSSRMGFVLPRAGHAQLRVIDAAGRVVRSIVDGPRAAGMNEVVWEGLDDRGAGVPAGLYFVVLDAGVRRVCQRMVWMR